MTYTRDACTCDTCQEKCAFKPGWFAPGEAEKAAELMGLPFAEFFEKHLAVDWWAGFPNIFVLAPAITAGTPGSEYPADPCGTCVFYQDGLCQIHDAKPLECRETWHEGENQHSHQEIGRMWASHQGQIAELLGRKPKAKLWLFGPSTDEDEEF